MTQQEFETLTGTELADGAYGEIERLYNETRMSKVDFADAWKGHKLSIAYDLLERVEKLQKNFDVVHDAFMKATGLGFDAAEALLAKANEYDDSGLKNAAIKLVGLKETIKIDVRNGYKLSKAEQDYIINNI